MLQVLVLVWSGRRFKFIAPRRVANSVQNVVKCCSGPSQVEIYNAKQPPFQHVKTGNATLLQQDTVVAEILLELNVVASELFPSNFLPKPYSMVLNLFFIPFFTVLDHAP